MGKVITHKKLVRDKIPEIIKASNAVPSTRQLTDDEYRKELLKKLVEEANELLESNGSLDERADVAEVLQAIDTLLKFDITTVEQARAKKATERGGFDKRIFLESTEENT